MRNREQERYELVLEMIRTKQFSAAIEGLKVIIQKEGRPSIALSLLGLALVRSGRDIEGGIDLCKEAIRKEPGNGLLYYNLADIYNRIKQKKNAIQILKVGLRAVPDHKKLINALNRFGIRKPPVFKFLDRSHPLNKVAGKIRSSNEGK